MATFQAIVEGMTGVSVGTSPTTGELTEYLKEGVLDVTSRVVTLGTPFDAYGFSRESSESTSQSGITKRQGRILAVLRESGTNNDWRDCRFIPINLQSRVTDTTSLAYASKENPAYSIANDGTIMVFPAPDSGGADSYKIIYINDTPTNGSGSSLAYNHDDIKYFPEDKWYLVAMFASVRTLQNALSAKSIPVVAGDATELTSVDDLDTDNVIDVHADQIEVDQWWSTAGHLIEGEEDTELAMAQIQKIQTYIQAHQSQTQANAADYGWMEKRLAFFIEQYNLAFQFISKQQQQQQGGR